MRALISIDYTYDFVDDKGALTCGAPGQQIHDEIVRVTKEFIENGDLVVFAIDKHLENDEFHPETKLFPPHNIVGTKGRELFGKLNDVYLSNKDKPNVIWIDKTRYSSFAGTNLSMLLRERNINEIFVTGVCTDICVLHTLIDGYNNGYKLNVFKDCVASFNQVGHEWTLEHFKNCMNVNIL